HISLLEALLVGLNLGPISFARFTRLANHSGTSKRLFWFVTEQWIKLNPRHVGLRDKRLMATGTFGCRGFLSRLRVRARMMPEVEVAPAVGLGKPLGVFHTCINAIKLAVEITASGGFISRSVRECRIKNTRQFFDNYGSFRKRPGLQIRIHILFL